MSKRKTILSLIFNILAFVSTAVIFVSYFFEEPSILIQNGFDSLKYFTTDSNILAAIVCAVTAVYDIRILSGKSDTLPQAVLILKFIGTACVTLTMVATVLFLMPVYGMFVLSGSLIVVHATTPLLALISFVFFETVHHISIPKSLLGAVSMMLYGIVYYLEVKVIGEANGGWKDFYAYNRGGHWLLSTVLMTSGCFVAAILTAVIHNIVLKKQKKH